MKLGYFSLVAATWIFGVFLSLAQSRTLSIRTTNANQSISTKSSSSSSSSLKLPLGFNPSNTNITTTNATTVAPNSTTASQNSLPLNQRVGYLISRIYEHYEGAEIWTVCFLDPDPSAEFGYRKLQVYYRMPNGEVWMINVALDSWSVAVPEFAEPQPQHNPDRIGINWIQVHLDINEATFFLILAGYTDPIAAVSIVAWGTPDLLDQPLYVFLLEVESTTVFVGAANGRIISVTNSIQGLSVGNGLPSNATMSTSLVKRG